MKTVMLIFGTRPEAIKLCPLARYLARDFRVRVCVTAQHRELLDRVLDVFSVAPDYDLNAMTPGQTLVQASSRILAGLERVLMAERPDMVVVQGDTGTTFLGALAAFYLRIPVAHVEAGLRTGDVNEPFPEEMNRVLTSRLASLHLAATASAAANLASEGVPAARISVTGNTGIDAVLYVRDALARGSCPGVNPAVLQPGRTSIVVTAHRRETFGAGLESICRALRRLAERPDVQLLFPVHPNPNVREVVRKQLAGVENVRLLEPLAYTEFVNLMVRSRLLLTDSGGIQEEAPSLGKPVLVMRNRTERPEAVAAGTARLVGTDPDTIVNGVAELLDDPAAYARMTRVHNPYGDGDACRRIAEAIAKWFAPARGPNSVEACTYRKGTHDAAVQ